MKSLLLLVAISFPFFPLIAQSAWIDPGGKPVPNTESMRSAGNFAAHLVLTRDEQQFRQTWNSTKGTPKLSSTNSVRLGSSVAAMLIFHGCMPNGSGVCEVVTEFILEGPNGVQTPAGGGPVWSSAPLQPGLLQVGHTSMNVGFDGNDQVGNYKVIANVKDKNSGRTLRLTAGLKVTK
jgi:hypothetical protein